MPSTLQALRRQAGFATARDFADHIGVPFPTYSRYQQGHRQAAARRERERAFEQLAAHYEAAMRRELMQQAFDLGEFYAPLDDEEEARDAFRKFITDLAARKRGRKAEGSDGKGDQKTIDELMTAYDRMHEWA